MSAENHEFNGETTKAADIGSTAEKTPPAPATIEEYIKSCPQDKQPRLREMYSVVAAAAPQAGQKISWSMPTFFVGKRRVHFAAQKKHVGFYPGVEAMEFFAAGLAPYKTGKGSVQFPFAQPLPKELISEMTAFVLEEREN